MRCIQKQDYRLAMMYGLIITVRKRPSVAGRLLGYMKGFLTFASVSTRRVFYGLTPC